MSAFIPFLNIAPPPLSAIAYFAHEILTAYNFTSYKI